MYFKIPNPVTIMIVDAYRQNYELFKTIAGFSDTPVRSFQNDNLNAAINYLSTPNLTNIPPEIIFCNEQIGERNGIEFLEKFAETKYGKEGVVPVYLISSNKDSNSIVKSASAFQFFKGILQNPIQIDELN